ncbi:XRE family transcriptional regulator [Pseudogulbenkiania ferrooxidans]|uniref:Putative phage repressor n=1 Tax=Pseudogulbenkiania ferrooxidans 2002 TaxID=279714 RepID=B9Z333_9NEIS|nr:helix-turn-helix transcriptional regulator [Pseudogulbenkiania ferrooxidans]EEG08986.1 putative phage repressor [Pseudogulbenkiania ferrooxidans 2002]
MSVSARLGHVIAEKGMSIKALSEKTGIPYRSLQNYFSGEREPSFDNLRKIVASLGVDANWFLFGENAQTGVFAAEVGVSDVKGHPVDLSEYVFIPRYRVQASAGNGRVLSDEDYMHSMAFRRYWVSNYLHAEPANLAIISVEGDSMEPTLKDHDVIMLDTSRRDPNVEGIYVLRLDDALLVKQVQRIPGKIRVSSANPAYPPFDVDLSNPAEDVAIIGKVVWFGRQM